MVCLGVVSEAKGFLQPKAVQWILSRRKWDLRKIRACLSGVYCAHPVISHSLFLVIFWFQFSWLLLSLYLCLGNLHQHSPTLSRSKALIEGKLSGQWKEQWNQCQRCHWFPAAPCLWYTFASLLKGAGKKESFGKAFRKRDATLHRN